MNARTAHRRPKAALAALLIALPLLLAGCGNKGPLILPPKQLPVDPSTLPSDNPNIAMPPAETTDDADTGAEPVDDTPAPATPTPTDEPDQGDDDGGRG